MSKSNLVLQLTNGIWLIDPRAIHSFAPTLKQIFERDVELLSKSAKRPSITMISPDGTIDLAPETGMGYTGTTPGSVAIVSVTGVIMKYDNCGDAGTQSLGKAVKALNANSGVSAIIFKMDTPGGSVSGTEDFAKIIKACTKPTVGFVDSLVASAGYWFISQCDEIYCSNKTDEVGSIGTMCSFEDVRPMLEKQGVVFHEVYADASKDKNQDFIQARKANYDLLKEQLNAINDVFIASVTASRGKKLDAKETLSGKVFFADDAVKVGLIDGIKTFDEVIQRAQSLIKSISPSVNTSINNNSTLPTMKIKAAWTAMIASLKQKFASVKEDDTITEEMAEHMNAEIATLATTKTSLSEAVVRAEKAEGDLATATTELATTKTNLEAAKTASTTQAKSITDMQAEIDRLCAFNPGATSTFKKEGKEAIGAADPNQSIIDNLPHNRAVDENPIFSK